jgi:hypothetical protein
MEAENTTQNGLVIDWAPSGRNGTVTLRARLNGEPVHTDELKIKRDKARTQFLNALAERCPALDRADAERHLLKVTDEVMSKPETPADTSGTPDATDLLAKMPESIRAEARAMLEEPDLLESIGKDFSAVGIAGERTLAGTIYLAGVSRLLDRPLAIVIQGPSSSGKSHVLRQVARMFPREAVFSATTLSPMSLYYAEPGTFRHRFVVCGERSRRTDEDQAEVTRALREFISEGRVSRLVTVKPNNGPPVAERVEQEGPIAYAESTTLATSDVFVEDLNRMLLLATNETPQQTKAVLRQVAERYTGGPRADVERVVQKHHAMQRLLRPMCVKIPYAAALVESLPSTRLEIRRGAGFILAMVEASALLHQYQRKETGDGELIATLDDYRVGRALLSEPLGRLLGRRVSDGALRFLGRLVEWFGVGGEYSIPEAKTKETHSVSGVYGWNSDLAGAGLIVMAQEKRGNAPARWRVAKSPDEAADSLALLPEAESLENT